MSDEPVIFRRSGVAARQAGLRKRREKSESPLPSNEDEDFDKDEMIEATSAVQKRRQLRRKNMIHTVIVRYLNCFCERRITQNFILLSVFNRCMSNVIACNQSISCRKN